MTADHGETPAGTADAEAGRPHRRPRGRRGRGPARAPRPVAGPVPARLVAPGPQRRQRRPARGPRPWSSSPSSSRSSPPSTPSCGRATSSTSSGRAPCTWCWRWPRSSSCCSARSTSRSARSRSSAGSIAFKLVQQPGPDWPWWAAILAALARLRRVRRPPGTLVARLRIPSFIVTLGGFLLFSGILIVILGGADGTREPQHSSAQPERHLRPGPGADRPRLPAGSSWRWWWWPPARPCGCARPRGGAERPGGAAGEPDRDQDRPGGARRGGRGG